MASSLADKQLQNRDTLLLSNFIYELSIARRHVTTYPIDHPIITTSIDKVLEQLRRLLSANSEFTVGVAKDTLVVEESVLDKNNPVFRDLARLFFSQGIASLKFTNQLRAKDLQNFIRVISLKRDQVESKGGIVKVLSALNINGVLVQTIDYRVFRATEVDTLHAKGWIQSDRQITTIWEKFARGLLKGIHEPGDSIDLDPDLLAKKLNHLAYEYGISGAPGECIAEFLNQIHICNKDKDRVEMLRRLNSLINRLSPELQRQLLSSAFSALASRNDTAQTVSSGLSENLLKALSDLNDRHGSLSQMLMNLVSKLSGATLPTTELDIQRPGTPENSIREKLNTIFMEDKLDEFLPEEYQKVLNSIVSDSSIAPAERSVVDELKLSLDANDIEEKISVIVMEIINNPMADIDPESMQKNLLDLCSYFLNTGDFKALSTIYGRIMGTTLVRKDNCCGEVMQYFSTAEFADEVLNGLKFWGKAKYEQISELIFIVGEPFVEPLLDRLAEEENMSLRRYYMERLKNMGLVARDAVISRLRDTRWYFVRNLILVLSSHGDLTIAPHIRRLTSHPHPKIRQESVKTLLSLRDPDADRLLLRDLSSSDNETRLAAVRLAEFSANPEVCGQLLKILSQAGLTGFEFELKSAAIHSLGMIGDPCAIPGIERFLKSRSILRAGQLNRLKTELLQSLKHYPRHAVSPLLATMAESRQSQISLAAKEILKNLNGGAGAI